MEVGFIGSGNMASALARGWGEPVRATDNGSGRAAALVEELGGEVMSSNAELADGCDLVILCHKPYQLDAVASEIAGRVQIVVSVLGGVSIAQLQAAFPNAQVFRMMPNTPVEVGRGVTCYCQAPGVDRETERAVLERFLALGTVVTLEEGLMAVAMGMMSVAPAYWALMAEAHIDAGVRAGLPAPVAAELAVEAIAGTAELLRARGFDTLAVRREVTSPGGSTARGLAALERAGIRAAFYDALDAVIDPTR